MTRRATPIDKGRLKELFFRLLSIYSPSGAEQEIVSFLYDYMRSRGLPVERRPVTEGRDNLVCFPSGKDTKAFFIGHVDTVKAIDPENFGPREDGDRVYALGATDMKGGCAAAVEAFSALWEGRQGGFPLGLALVVGEETDGDGATALMREHCHPFAIMAEGTDMRPCLSHSGYVGLELHARGERLHASLAPRGQGAVKVLLQVLNRLSDFFDDRMPGVVYNVRNLHSSRDGFAVSETAEAWLDLHLPPEASAKASADTIEGLLRLEQASAAGAELAWEFEPLHDGYILAENEPAVVALRSAFGDCRLPWAPVPFPSHSDGNVLWDGGTRAVVVGPGLIEKAHRLDEFVSWSQVVDAADVYYRTGLRLLNKKRGASHR